MFGLLARGLATAGSGLMRLGVKTPSMVRSVANVPLVKTVAKALPYGAAAYSAGDMLFNRGGSNLPALPGLPGLPTAPGMGDRSIFRNDPNVVEALKPYAISAHNLKTYHRAPKGFVIVYDSAGMPYGLPKKVAQWAGLWKPGHKPPISVGDYQSLKRADRTVRKMRKIFSMVARVDKNTSKGGKVKVKKGRG